MCKVQKKKRKEAVNVSNKKIQRINGQNTRRIC